MQQHKIDEIAKEIADRCENEEEVKNLLSCLVSVNWPHVMAEATVLKDKMRHRITCQSCNTYRDSRECERVVIHFALLKTTCSIQGITMCMSCMERNKCLPITCKFCQQTSLSTKQIKDFICGKCSHIVETVSEQNNRARLLGLPYTLTAEQWKQTLDHFKEQCAYCNGKIQCVEHYIPMTLNGGTTAANCIPACIRCNLKKKDIHPSKIDRLFPADNLVRIREYLASVAVVAV